MEPDLLILCLNCLDGIVFGVDDVADVVMTQGLQELKEVYPLCARFF